MVAYSKASKLKAKRGRPKKEGVARTESGQISRAKESAIKVAQDARMRIFGMTASEALSQVAGDNLGRLHLAWQRDHGDGISKEQYDAAERYREVLNDYRKSRLSHGAHYERGGLIGAYDPDGYEAWVIRAKEAYDGARDAILEAQFEERTGNLWAAVQYMLEDDIYLPHMLGDIRTTCNALYRHFFTQKRRKVA